MRYLGIDYGSKKIGLALSDEAGTMGFPHSVMTQTGRLFDELLTLIKKERVDAVVIGESRNFSGEDNPIAKDARALGEKLKENNVPVHYEPETFTTQEARRYPDGTRMPGSPDVDSSAAALILTSFLERYTATT